MDKSYDLKHLERNEMEIQVERAKKQAADLEAKTNEIHRHLVQKQVTFF